MSYQHIFGPVLSRRLGVSLGVDLVSHKICCMDCIYCECGKTTRLTSERKNHVPFEKVIKELNHFFTHHPDPDYITFSGSGEPSLNIHLGEVIAHIKEKKPHVKVAVLTNAGLFSDTQVRKEMLRADLVVPSLDAAGPETFTRINRPHGALDINQIIKGLTTFRKEYNGQIYLEILILPGINDNKKDLLLLKSAVQQIRPDRVQLNTLDRPGTLAYIRPASKRELQRVMDILDFEPVEIIANVAETIQAVIRRSDIKQAIVETIHRRPCTQKDLAKILGLDASQVGTALSELEREEKITAATQKRGVFYQTRKGVR